MDAGKQGGPGTRVTFAEAAGCSREQELERAVGELVSAMSLGEKIAQLSGRNKLVNIVTLPFRYNYRTYDAGENRRLGIPDIRFTDGPRGVALDHSTCFPVPMARGASWDPELEERIGSAIGVEARAQGANFFGGVCINVLRHPGWGRAQETFGEDPYHLGVMGVAMVEGLQRHVMACVKHFACNSIEEARFRVDVRIDERALREIYLPHFRRCAEAGVAAFMSAYNKVNGYFCGHNRHLLRDILKNDWGFEGFVISDFLLGIRSAGAAVKGGLDIEMPITIHYGGRLKKLVERGEIQEDLIDDSVTRILRQKARFAGVGKRTDYDRGRVSCAEHTELALQSARKGIVLLKNHGGTLPLEREKVGRIAVVGKLADRANIGDRGSSQVYPRYTVTPLQGIRSRAGASVGVTHTNGKRIDQAVKAARQADAAVVVAGLTGKEEGEFIPFPRMGGDRIDLGLPAEQVDLIEAVSDANDRCVVVLEGGSAITMGGWKDRVGAIMMAWYPGMEGGTAIGEVLFGDVNPSGRLPFAWPRAAHQLFQFDKRAKTAEYDRYHGYRYYDERSLEPEFPFGFGLSYTEFEYGNLRLDSEKVTRSGSLEVEVEVRNVGNMAGEEVVQLYVGYGDSRVDRAQKDLKGFKKLHLEPGGKETVSLDLRIEELAYYDVDEGSWVVEETDYIALVGPSSRQEDLLEATFSVRG